jgi:hypothetical protein
MVVTAALLLSGSALLAVGWEAHGRLNPGSVEVPGTTFRVVRRVEPQAVVFDLLYRDGSVATSISGSTDTLCDPPYLVVVDVDQDGVRDVLYRHCSGHGYVAWRNGGWVDVDLGQFDTDDLPAATSLWVSEIRAGGWHLLALGTILVLAGLAFIAVLLSSRNLRKHATGG